MLQLIRYLQWLKNRRLSRADIEATAYSVLVSLLTSRSLLTDLFTGQYLRALMVIGEKNES